MNSLWIAIGVLGVLGLLFGLILGYSARRFKVEEDPIVEKLMPYCHRVNVVSVVILVVALMQKR